MKLPGRRLISLHRIGLHDSKSWLEVWTNYLISNSTNYLWRILFFKMGINFRKLLLKVRSIFDRCIDATALITTIGVVFLMVSVNIEVILRYLTGKAHPWVVELTEYTLLIVTLLGAAWVLRREEHIIRDLLLTRLKPRGRAMLEAINYGISAVFCFIVVWYGASNLSR